MSRSTKHLERMPVWYQRDSRPGTEKAGAGDRPSLRPRSARQEAILRARRNYGRTEKILRRNRKRWARMFAKEGRRLDKEEIVRGLEAAEPRARAT